MLQKVPAKVIRTLKKMGHLLEMKAHRWLNRPMGNRLIFVGGAPRSGTTLVQLILNAHPDIYGGPEFGRLPDIINTWQRTAEDHQRGRISTFCSRMQIDTCFANLIEHLLLPTADRHGARLLSEKTPINVLVFSSLLEILPEARAIHVVRDPRAVVASLLQVGQRCLAKGGPIEDFTQDINLAINFTTKCLNAGFQAGSVVPNRVHTVLYEDLVTNPEPTIQKLCAFLKITLAEQMLEPHTQPHPDHDLLTKADGGRWNAAQGFGPIEASRMEAWRNLFKAQQIEAIQAAFRSNEGLLSLGYYFD